MDVLINLLSYFAFRADNRAQNKKKMDVLINLLSYFAFRVDNRAKKKKMDVVITVVLVSIGVLMIALMLFRLIREEYKNRKNKGNVGINYKSITSLPE